MINRNTNHDKSSLSHLHAIFEAYIFLRLVGRSVFQNFTHFDYLILDAVDDDSEDGPPLSIDEFL